MSVDSDTARPLIVVGVDGSDESVKATAWAAEQARATGGTLELLIVWARPMSYGLPLVVGGYNPEHEAQAVVEKTASGIDLPASTAAHVTSSTPPRHSRWSSARRARISSSSDRVGTADLPSYCSGRSAITAFTTRVAPSSSSDSR